MEHAVKTGWDDAALRTMYYRGLKDNVKDELMRIGNTPESLEQLSRAAINIDDKLYERSQEKRHSGQIHGRSSFAANS